jgi:uncharacterized protein with LGFP repeats
MTEVIGAIRDKWMALGGEAGYGAARDVERATFDGVGRWQPFGTKGGIITWHPSVGAYEVHGLIAQKWIWLGREQWGYPITDERTTPDQRGRYNHFRVKVPGYPDASIYWAQRRQLSPAMEVHGAIRAKWASLGWERGKLGYPLSDETRGLPGLGEGSRSSKFDGGRIDWTPEHGAQVVFAGTFDPGTVQQPV